MERKLTTFLTKAQTNDFLKRLHNAEFNVVDSITATPWRFDDHGRPTLESLCAVTVLSAMTTYVAGRWGSEWSPSQRAKVRGRLLELVAATTGSTKDHAALLDGLESQRLDRGARPAPATTIEWAARWLRDHAFYPGPRAQLSVELEAGKRWLEARSMSVSALDVTSVTTLRLYFTRKGLKYDSQRTYWSGCVVPFLRWLYDAGLVERPLLGGQVNLKRDIVGEQPDPHRITSVHHTHLIARHFREHHGAVWGLYPLISTFCAVRIGEAMDIQLSHFAWKNERLFLRRQTQTHREIRACSESGETVVKTKTKSMRPRTPTSRLIPISQKLAAQLVEMFGERLGTDEGYLIVGPRGSGQRFDHARLVERGGEGSD